MTRLPRICLLLVLASLFSGCASVPKGTSKNPAPPPQTAATAVIAEAWLSDPVTEDELDSLAVWPTKTGGVWIIATAKSSHRLAVYDGETGQRLRTVGERGSQPGQFYRPNGIAVLGDLLFVVERDNHRIQVMRLPDFKPLGTVGDEVLKSPYGLWLQETAPSELEVYVTDSFLADVKTMALPPLADLDQRIRHFHVSVDEDDRLGSRLLGSFGDTGEAGALRMVESIAGDPHYNRLLIAEEDRRIGSTLREYSLQGRYQDNDLPPFDADAEGISLWSCGRDSGYWIAVDQVAPTLFRLFDRRSLAPVGIFSGKVVANTDGEVIHLAATPRFPSGALFALHDDRSIAAFDLRDIALGLQLRDNCR